MFKFVKYNTIPVVSTLYVQYMCVYVCVCAQLNIMQLPPPPPLSFQGITWRDGVYV